MYFQLIEDIENSKFQLYKCLHCGPQGTVFKTHIDAMVAHTEEHKHHRIIRIYEDKKEEKRFLRPQQHYYNNKTEKYQVQSDVQLMDVIVPISYNKRNNRVYCRKCNLFGVEIYDDTGAMIVIKLASSRQHSS